jgi:hypothetical protein
VMSQDTIWNHMAGSPYGVGIAGSSFVTSTLRFSSSLLSHDLLYLQVLPTMNIPASTSTMTSTIAASNRPTASLTIATRWKCGTVSSLVLPSTHPFVVSTLPTFSSSLIVRQLGNRKRICSLPASEVHERSPFSRGRWPAFRRVKAYALDSMRGEVDRIHVILLQISIQPTSPTSCRD